MVIIYRYIWLINIYLNAHNFNKTQSTNKLVFMDIRKIKKLIELVEQSSILKLEISEGKNTIRILKSSLASFPSSPSSTTQETERLPNLSNTQKNNQISNTLVEEEYVVRSPIVGVFYRSPHATDKPFISIGQLVNVGDTLCIIEAMKVMNHIQSDKCGIVQAILVNNGQPVEFDEPLLIIKQKTGS